MYLGAVGAAATLLDTNGRARIMASFMTRLVRAKEVYRLYIDIYLCLSICIYTSVSRRRRGGGHRPRGPPRCEWARNNHGLIDDQAGPSQRGTPYTCQSIYIYLSIYLSVYPSIYLYLSL